ncbi:nitroreductase family deazaflavin-dependent oxidoreductase [Streptomyces gardneri]|uniref:nitroreductase/quinone reductase family protein n=1 Tax=Nocardia TaxID=1817 RepID=UPI00135C232C|nr:MULTISPECIES: nitroreductase/quinone reductase family protein [Nocardia]MBF6163740.1 nitroreductase family deazaflavin-dependent oxidoreductase [Streptomyces gardneri]
MTDPEIRPENFNRAIIAEFRANAGKVGGMFEGASLLLLTTAGSKTGRRHTVPVVYRPDGDRVLVFGSNAGADNHPAWFHNVRANPEVTVEIGEGERIRTYTASARVLEGAERDRHYAAQASDEPAFAAYRAATDRTIPVVALEPLERRELERRRFLMGTGAVATVAAGVAGTMASADSPGVAAPAQQRAAAVGDHLRQVHAQLRRDLTEIRASLAEYVRAPDVAAQPTPPRDLRAHCLAFCGALGEHHTGEDGVFPALVRLHPELAPVVDRLSREHGVVATALTELRTLLDPPHLGDPARLRTEFERLATELETHFTYEEDTLVDTLNATDPAALRSGGQR